MGVPTHVYVGDLVLHEDVYAGAVPKLRVLELGELGVAEVNDETRDVDALDVLERIEPLGSGVDAFRIAEIPNYVELLQHVCTKLGWDSERFRGYRTRIEYPIFGSQVQFAFDVPIEPSPLPGSPERQ